MENAMTLRVVVYLVFMWANIPLALQALGANGSIYRAWWLLLLCLMTSLSLVSLVTTDPGRVPSDTVQQLGALETGAVVTQQGQSFNHFCSLCNVHKPARTHHCRICNSDDGCSDSSGFRSAEVEKCVLKMDHHCHWVGHCVGLRNYKAYLLVLFYGVVSCGAMLVVVWKRWHSEPVLGSLPLLVLAVDGMIVVLAFVFLFYLLMWHGYLATANVTTIEYFKWKRSMRDPANFAPAPRPSVRQSEYNRGLLPNLREALGHELWLWPWPGLGRWSSLGCGARWSAVTGWSAREASRADSAAAGAGEAKSALFPSSARSPSRCLSAVSGDEADGAEIPALHSPHSPTNSV